MRSFKIAIAAMVLFSTCLISGAVISEWSVGAIQSSTDVFDNVVGGLIVCIGIFLFVGLPMAFLANRAGLRSRGDIMAVLGFVGGTSAMGALILLVDGLPLYFPQDVVPIASAGLGGALGALVWAKAASTANSESA